MKSIAREREKNSNARNTAHDREINRDGGVRHTREVRKICRDMLRGTDRQGDNEEERETERETEEVTAYRTPPPPPL